MFLWFLAVHTRFSFPHTLHYDVSLQLPLLGKVLHSASGGAAASSCSLSFAYAKPRCAFSDTAPWVGTRLPRRQFFLSIGQPSGRSRCMGRAHEGVLLPFLSPLRVTLRSRRHSFFGYWLFVSSLACRLLLQFPFPVSLLFYPSLLSVLFSLWLQVFWGPPQVEEEPNKTECRVSFKLRDLKLTERCGCAAFSLAVGVRLLFFSAKALPHLLPRALALYQRCPSVGPFDGELGPRMRSIRATQSTQSPTFFRAV